MDPLETARERARELGRILGQTDEYRALEHARTRLAEEREAVKSLNRMAELETRIQRALEKGEDPGKELREEYERMFSEIQSSPVYQGLVAAQSNFDRIVGKVNDEILSGIEAGARSRIIVSS